jgi:hypothetical protein
VICRVLHINEISDQALAAGELANPRIDLRMAHDTPGHRYGT